MQVLFNSSTPAVLRKMTTIRIKNSKYKIHGNIHQGRNFKNYTTVTLILLIIYSRDTVTISSVLVEPNVISRGKNPTLVIFSKKPESQSFTLKIESECC